MVNITNVVKEICNLIKANNVFKGVCIVKLAEKMDEGYLGWDELTWRNKFETRILGYKPSFTQGELINISNYCMFLWNIAEKEKGGGK